jgi:hypothetical protein
MFRSKPGVVWAIITVAVALAVTIIVVVIVTRGSGPDPSQQYVNCLNAQLANPALNCPSPPG